MVRFARHPSDNLTHIREYGNADIRLHRQEVNMKLTFLGTGSAYNPISKNTSGYTRFGGTMLLFDCGETVFETLFRRGLFERFENFLIVITHFHSDHCGSLGSMISYCYNVLKKPVFIFYPNTNICSYLTLTGVPQHMYEYYSTVPEMFADELEIIPYTVQHDPMIHCFGYLVRIGKQAFFYGGDSMRIPPEILLLLEQGKICEIYQDVTHDKGLECTCHGSLERLCQYVDAQFRSKVICMHFSGDFSERIHLCGFQAAVAEGRDEGTK